MDMLKIRCIANRLITSGSILGLLVVSQLLTSISVAQTPEPVVWTDMVGVTDNGNTLTKTEVNSWENGGAASTQVITGDGSVSVLADQTNTYRMFGLSSTNANARYQTINYALYMLNNGTLQVFENGNLRGSFGNYSANDRLSVERAGSIVTYKQGGTVFYTSTIASSGSLLVDATLYSQGAILSDVMIAGVEGSQPSADAQVFDTDVIIGDAGQNANLEVYGTSTLGPVNLDVNGGNLGPADNVNYEMAPFWLKHNGFNFGIDGDQLSMDAAPFIIQNSNPDGDIIFQTGAINIDRLVIDSDGNVKVPSPAGDIPTITYE